MAAAQLNPKQKAALGAILTRHGRFYYRLVKRMERLDWPMSDPVYQRALCARNAVDALRVFVDQIGQNPPAPPTTPGIIPRRK